jgi:hypothetical protein
MKFIPTKVALALLALTATANAQETVSPLTPGVANAVTVAYTLVPGASSKPIAVAANVPVHLIGVQTAVGFRGVGEVALLKIPGNFLEWVGLESTSGAAITQGFSGTPGTHIVWIDFSHQVDVEVANPNQILVHNGSSGVRTGSVTLIW